ncbi:MAG: branched-chain amino acid transport system substrate-binding protein [Rhodothermales bacterium]|jgi:branched-chain amino acid transport system substrate-binding protein
MRRLLPLLLAGILLSATSVSAQQLDPRVSELPEAQTLFDQALSTFESGDYTNAAGQFSRVASAYQLHTLTTAAALMEGRALYRAGAYQRAIETFDTFRRVYQSSRYISEAQRTRKLASDAIQVTSNSPVTIGVILSLDDVEASASQSLFNGFRMAVDDHNARREGRPVRMVFRDIGELGSEGAVASAVEAGAHTVFGALFSDQARAAAAEAERLEVVFVAPLATDEEVSRDRLMSFQANPTIEMRGRLMARFAVNGLRLRDLGVVAEHDEHGISGVMGNAFADEARLLGATVRFVQMLPDTRSWFSIGDHIPADSLRAVRGIYAPLSGSAADQLAGALLDGLNGLLTASEQKRLRVLGNAEWHDLPMRAEASRFGVTYSNDFYFDRTSDAAQPFTRRYRSMTGVSPGRLSIVGYDLGRYLASTVESEDPLAVRARLLGAPAFEGLGVRLLFGGGQVNRQMYYHRYRDGRLELMR